MGLITTVLWPVHNPVQFKQGCIYTTENTVLCDEICIHTNCRKNHLHYYNTITNNDGLLTALCTVGIRSTRLGITDLVTGYRVTYFRFGHVSGTQSTTSTTCPKVSSITYCKGNTEKCNVATNKAQTFRNQLKSWQPVE